MLCIQYTYLGVTLDETLNLESNFNAILKKFSYKLFQFSKVRKYLPINVRLQVYKQAVLPLVEYVSFLLFLNRKHDIDKLQKLQNRALRLCFDIIDPRTISVIELHQRANLLTLSQRREKQLLGIMYDISRKEEFVKSNLVCTRQAAKIVLISEVAQYSIYVRSPYIVGSSLWNNLDANVQKIENKNEYKLRIKDLYHLPQNPNT